jgi:hypothetical protein
MPATFISKEEIIAGVREIPAAGGAVAPATNSPLGIFGQGGSGNIGTNPIDQVERILSQINGILTQVNSIRNNPTTRALIGSAQASAQTGTPSQFVESAARPISSVPMAAQTVTAAPAPLPARAPQISVNEEGVKEFLAAIMAELDKMPDDLKGMKISTAIVGFNLVKEQREQLERNATARIAEWLPKIVKVE